MPDKLILTINAGPQAGKTFVFEEHNTLLLGRADDCQICLPVDQQVSRHHFLLEVNPPDARLRDLGSRNGTYINRQKYGGRDRRETPEEGAKRHYPQVDLSDGDEITVGQTSLLVHVEATLEPATPALGPEDDKAPSNRARAPESISSEGDAGRTRVEHEASERLLAGLKDGSPQELRNSALSDYAIVTLLGEGGMGAVYLAKHKQTGEPVAVKVMRSKVRVSEQARKQFLREIEATRTLQHPHLVHFLGSGYEGSIFYFLLEYCAGGSMADLMKRWGGRLSLTEAMPLLLQTLIGLAFVHEQGFVHRDLKPHNILLTGQEGQWITKLSDLGLAKSFEQAGFSGMTATGSFAGSFPFMPREQVINFKRVQPTSDVWAMGATCYLLLTGTYPREQRPGQDPLLAILQEESVPIRQRNPHIPAGVAEVIDRSLATKEGERYQHAGEMYKALLRAWKDVQ
jgi:pSer/pThr/pTyr-binding forkhead associated (FHA) protein